MILEPITLENTEEAYLLVIKMLKESRFDIREIIPQEIINSIVKYIAFPDTHYGVLARNDDGEPIGYFFGYTVKRTFNHDICAKDESIYIIPEYRGRLLGKMLIYKFEEWAKLKGIKTVQLSIITDIDLERTTQMYSTLGYQHVGNMTEKVM